MIFDKIDDDMRRATEFIIRVKGVYALADIKRLDFITYFKILNEAEEEQAEQVARMEAQQKAI